MNFIVSVRDRGGGPEGIDPGIKEEVRVTEEKPSVMGSVRLEDLTDLVPLRKERGLGSVDNKSLDLRRRRSRKCSEGRVQFTGEVSLQRRL